MTIYAIMIQSDQDIWYYHPTMYTDKKKAEKVMQELKDKSIAEGHSSFQWADYVQAWQNNDFNIRIEEFELV